MLKCLSLKKPSFLMILTNTKPCYQRTGEIYAIALGFLKNQYFKFVHSHTFLSFLVQLFVRTPFATQLFCQIHYV